MAKLKRGKRNQRARHNPMGQKGVGSGMDSKQDETTRNTKILPLLEKLQSSSPNDKSMALGAITVLAEDEKMRKMMMKEKLIQIVMEKCLTDNNDELIVEAFGLLRNLGIDEGYDVLKYYWRSNIWVTIEASLAKVEQSFKFLQENKDLTLSRSTNVMDLNAGSNKKKEDEKSKQQLLFDFTEHIISLIIILGNSSDDLYESVFDKLDPVLTFVIHLINYNISHQKLTNKLHNCLLEFIYEFSNESDAFIKKLQLTELSLPGLESFAGTKFQESNALGKTYVEGIKFHLNEVINNGADKYTIGYDILAHLFNNLSNIDLQELKKNLTPNDNANEPIKNSGIKDDYERKQSCRNNLTNLEIAVDLTTSIFEYLAINDDFRQSVVLPEEIVELIFKTILPSLVELIQFELNNNGSLLLLDKLTVCLNNLAWLMISIENTPIKWFESSSQVWELVLKVSSSEDEAIQANSLNILWALVKAFGLEIKSQVSVDMVNLLINKGQGYMNQLQDEKNSLTFEQVNCYLSIVGFTGNLAVIIENTEITFNISEFLLKTIQVFIVPQNHQNDPKRIELVIESINVLFDIFGDKDYSYDYEIFVQQDYLNKLSGLVTPMKDMYKKVDKNRFGDLKIRAEETWNNLERFIKYKQSERQ